MKMKNVFAAVLAIAVVLIACRKEGLLNDSVKNQSLSNSNTALGLNSNTRSGKNTCIKYNGKDSCYKIPMPSDTTHHGGGKDSTSYPGGSKDTCIKGNGKDTCFKLPIPNDSALYKKRYVKN